MAPLPAPLGATPPRDCSATTRTRRSVRGRVREQQELPGYTFRKALGEWWRSQYDADQNVIVINNGHRDFVYASRKTSLQMRYICRLSAKELVYQNFSGCGSDQLLERMIDLTLDTEEHLR